jgi:acid phosphatase class B
MRGSLAPQSQDFLADFVFWRQIYNAWRQQVPELPAEIP